MLASADGEVIGRGALTAGPGTGLEADRLVELVTEGGGSADGTRAPARVHRWRWLLCRCCCKNNIRGYGCGRTMWIVVGVVM
jgi:hypothetical protein